MRGSYVARHRSAIEQRCGIDMRRRRRAQQRYRAIRGRIDQIAISDTVLGQGQRRGGGKPYYRVSIVFSGQQRPIQIARELVSIMLIAREPNVRCPL